MIKLLKFHGLVILLLFSFAGILSISAQVHDFQTRWEVSAEKGFDAGPDLTLSLEQRFKENSIQYDRSLITAEAKYYLGKGFAVSSGVRWIVVQNLSLHYENRYRINADLVYDLDINSFNLNLRSRLQYGFDDHVLRFAFNDNKLSSRNGCELGYHFFGTKWTILGGADLYIQLNNAEGPLPYRSKFLTGFKYDINLHSSIRSSYIFDQEFNLVNPLKAHVIETRYRYKF